MDTPLIKYCLRNFDPWKMKYLLVILMVICMYPRKARFPGPILLWFHVFLLFVLVPVEGCDPCGVPGIISLFSSWCQWKVAIHVGFLESFHCFHLGASGRLRSMWSSWNPFTVFVLVPVEGCDPFGVPGIISLFSSWCQWKVAIHVEFLESFPCFLLGVSGRLRSMWSSWNPFTVFVLVPVEGCDPCGVPGIISLFSSWCQWKVAIHVEFLESFHCFRVGKILNAYIIMSLLTLTDCSVCFNFFFFIFLFVFLLLLLLLLLLLMLLLLL